MQVDDKLAKEKLASLIEVLVLPVEPGDNRDPEDELFYEFCKKAAQLIRNTDLTDCRVESPTWLEVGALHGQVEELTKKLAAAPDQGSVRNATDELLDAKRYRWLRDATSDVCEDSGITLICNSSMFGTRGLEGAEWDAAIDAAIRALPDQKD